MPLVVGTNSYGSIDEADTYFDERPFSTDWTSADFTNKENALMMATLHLDWLFEWKGQVVTEGQALEWPRKNVYDHRGHEVSSASIPDRVKKAQFELAMQWVVGDQLTPPGTHLTQQDTTSTRELKRQKLGSLEQEFRDASVSWETKSGNWNNTTQSFNTTTTTITTKLIWSDFKRKFENSEQYAETDATAMVRGSDFNLIPPIAATVTTDSEDYRVKGVMPDDTKIGAYYILMLGK